MTGHDERKISSIRDLPRDIAPPRDLWQGIEAKSAAERAQSGEADDRSTQRHSGGGSWRRGVFGARSGALAAAAAFAMLAVGIWIGRVMLPVGGAGDPATPGGAVTKRLPAANEGEGGSWYAAHLMDSKYSRDRAKLVRDLEARLNALPPDSRAKVVASLQTISDSKRELEKELGKDPSNALLQELLVNTYQDEMRLLITVHEAGAAAGGI